MRHAETLAAEREAGFVRVEDDARRTGDFHELNRGKPDGTGADDEDIFPGLDAGAIDGVTTDGERLDEGELIVAELARDMEFARGENHALAETAVAHDAERLIGSAAIGETAPAGVTFLAIQVWLDRATITGLHVDDALAHLEHLDAELMTGNARIRIERHFPQITAEIRAADTHAMDAHQDLARGGRGRLGHVERAERLGFFELDGFHGRGGGAG